MTDRSSTTQTKISEGSIVRINDHVYLTPEHLGEPYYIGRIMEFCHVPKRKGLQVRVAWFSRPKDVFNRRWYDSALLIATMNSDLVPVSTIRGKCKVIHKHYIPKDQFEQYRSTENHFYYTQLYDRYMQRVYDLLPCDLVQNVPMDVQEALCQRYQFIIVEQGKAADLTGARRTCCVCQTWCNSASSVKCAGCQKNFHMACLSPPLTRKPSKGFAWQCAFCSKKEMETASPSTTSSPPAHMEVVSPIQSQTSGKRTVRLRSQQQQQQQQDQKQSPKEKEKRQQESLKAVSRTLSTLSKNMKIYEDPSQITTTHMWPFRYFGVNTNIKDILDIDDRIYPRAASRIGAKYQATVPDWKETVDDDLTTHKKLTSSPFALSPTSPPLSSSVKCIVSSQETVTKRLERRGRPSKRKDISPSQSSSDDPLSLDDEKAVVRGTSNTVTSIFSQPAILDDNELDDYISNVQELQNLPLEPYSSDTYDLALLTLAENDYDTTKALEKIQQMTADDFDFLVSWQADEIDAFEQSIQEHGHELQYVKQRIPTKSMADIVRFFYQWKKSDRYQPVYSTWTKVFRPTKQFKKYTRSILECLSRDQQDDQELIQLLTAQSKIKQHSNGVNGKNVLSSNDGSGENSASSNNSSGDEDTEGNDHADKDDAEGTDDVNNDDDDDDGDDDEDDDDDGDDDDDDDDDDGDYVEKRLPRRSTRSQASTTSANTNTTTTTTTTISIAAVRPAKSTEDGGPTRVMSTRATRSTRQSTLLTRSAAANQKKNLTTTTTIPTQRQRRQQSYETSNKLKEEDSQEKDEDNYQDDDFVFDDPSVIPATATSKNNQPFQCLNCGTQRSLIWRRAPGDTDRKRKVFDLVLCDECGIHWLKYGKKRPVAETVIQLNTSAAIPRGRGRPNKILMTNELKRKRMDENSDATMSKKVKDETMVAIARPLSPCLVCRSMEHPKKLIACRDCYMVVHEDCFGVSRKRDNQPWQCDICKNKENPSVSYFYQCVLCGTGECNGQAAMKPTSGYNWAHVTCALFFPQVKFIHLHELSPIEYAGAVTNAERKKTCRICHAAGRGACVSCSDENCQFDMHVECALNQGGCELGFTIRSASTQSSSLSLFSPPSTLSASTPPTLSSVSLSTSSSSSPSADPVVPAGKFGKSSEEGVIVPQIYCPQHRLTRKQRFYPMNTRTTEMKSWISVYASLYKHCNPNTTPAMRRYSAWCQRNGQPSPCYRLHTLPSVTEHSKGDTSAGDHGNIVDGRNTKAKNSNKRKSSSISKNGNSLSELLHPSCSLCPVVSSPFWWDMDDGLASRGKKICQRCYNKRQTERRQDEIQT